MIVKNEYVKIKTDKEVILHNYIYDNYLELIAQAQYRKEVQNFEMASCYLKFKTPFEDIYNKEPGDFDIKIELNNKKIVGSSSTVEVNYIYTPNNKYLIKASDESMITNLEDYYGEKITAIGFGGLSNFQRKIFSCMDLTNYSVYFEENISFSRKDIFSTDATSTNDYPINLTPFSQKYVVESEGHGDIQYYCYPVLYSIGLGTRRGEMEEEYIIGEDVDVIIESPTSFSFNLCKGLEPNKFPTQNLYLKNGLYPLPLKVSKELHPNKKLYTGSGAVPLLSDYKYIIYKYRYYYHDDFRTEYVYLDEYFTTNLPNNTKGLFKIVTKIERSDV